LALREVDEKKAKTHFPALVRAVEKTGETVLITRDGRAVAKLEPAGEGSQLEELKRDARR
jgi:prevent-host-death family protein